MRGISSSSKPIRASFPSTGLGGGAQEVLPASEWDHSTPARRGKAQQWVWLPPTLFTNEPSQLPQPGCPPSRSAPHLCHRAWSHLRLPKPPAPHLAVPWTMPCLPRSEVYSPSVSWPGVGSLLASASPWWGQEGAWELPVVGGCDGAEGRWLGTAPMSQLGNWSSP